MTEGTAVGSFIPALRDMFGRVVEIKGADLAREEVLKGLDLLVLPGIATEFSHYPDVLTPDARGVILRAVRNGLRLWTDCAASYIFCETYGYDSPTRKAELRHGVGLFEGHAWGPVDRDATLIPERKEFAHTRVVRVAFGAAAAREEALIAYHNGPVYTPAGGEKIEVLASYLQPGLTDQPIAAFAKRYGRGVALFSGILPEMNAADLRIDDRAASQSVVYLRHLKEVCLQHDAARRRLLSLYRNVFLSLRI